jgi:hypothetical protein
MTCRQFVFPVLLLVAIAVAQSDQAAGPPSSSARNTAQDLTADQKSKVELLAKLQKHFGKDMNSPGVELSLKETDRSRSGDRTLVTYNLYGTGLSLDTTFTLIQVQLDGTMAKVMEGVTLNGKGEAICAGRKAHVRAMVPTTLLI